MSCNVLSCIRNYWITNINHAMHDMIINFMSRTRWKQIKRYLKIFNLLEDQKIDTRDVDWWKKLESLTSEFRKASKTYWLSDSHVSVDEQLVKFKKRSCHTMQIISKATEIEFKLYSLCQQNFLYDFLFISKVWSQNVENLYAKWLIFCSASQDQRVKINAAIRFFKSHMKNDIIFFANDSAMQMSVCRSITCFICRQFLHQCKAIQSSENVEYWSIWNGKSWKWISQTTDSFASSRHEGKTLRKDGFNDHWWRGNSLYDMGRFEHRTVYDHYAYDWWDERDDV